MPHYFTYICKVTYEVAYGPSMLPVCTWTCSTRLSHPLSLLPLPYFSHLTTPLHVLSRVCYFPNHHMHIYLYLFSTTIALPLILWYYKLHNPFFHLLPYTFIRVQTCLNVCIYTLAFCTLHRIKTKRWTTNYIYIYVGLPSHKLMGGYWRDKFCNLMQAKLK